MKTCTLPRPRPMLPRCPDVTRCQRLGPSALGRGSRRMETLSSLLTPSPPTVAPWTPTTTPATRPTCPPARPPPPPPSPPSPSSTLQQSFWLLETPGAFPAPCLLLQAREGGIPQTGSSSVHQVLSDGRRNSRKPTVGETKDVCLSQSNIYCLKLFNSFILVQYTKSPV